VDDDALVAAEADVEPGAVGEDDEDEEEPAAAPLAGRRRG
jgi:hypothetical protein